MSPAPPAKNLDPHACRSPTQGIGLDLNEALAYWRQAMSRRTPPEKFNKEYAYNIRHNYGKEGTPGSFAPLCACAWCVGMCVCFVPHRT